MGRVIITEEELDQSIFQFGPSKEGMIHKDAGQIRNSLVCRER